MTETHLQLATEIAHAARDLNEKFRQAEKLGLHVVAKVNEFVSLDHHRSDKQIRIEVALLLPVSPQVEERR